MIVAHRHRDINTEKGPCQTKVSDNGSIHNIWNMVATSSMEGDAEQRVLACAPTHKILVIVGASRSCCTRKSSTTRAPSGLKCPCVTARIANTVSPGLATPQLYLLYDGKVKLHVALSESGDNARGHLQVKDNWPSGSSRLCSQWADNPKG